MTRVMTLNCCRFAAVLKSGQFLKREEVEERVMLFLATAAQVKIDQSL